MNIARIKFLQNAEAMWYWQYIDEFQVIQAESTKLYETLPAAVQSAELVCGLKLEMNYGVEFFGRLERLWVYRPKPIGVHTLIGIPTPAGLVAEIQVNDEAAQAAVSTLILP